MYRCKRKISRRSSENNSESGTVVNRRDWRGVYLLFGRGFSICFSA